MGTQLTEAVTDALDKARDDETRETIDNKERGCGFLQANACYLRSDVTALSAADGEIPRFVELDDPVEYREHTGRGAIIPGWKAFPGNAFGKHYVADGRTTTPSDDIHEHAQRLWKFGFDGDHYANITSAQAHDVLMSVGASNWETPDDYVAECRDRGLNLRIPVSDNSPPPVVEPLRTRVWVIHPNGAGDSRPAIIGYAYVTRNVFTTGTDATDADPDVPGWAEDYADTRPDFDLVDRGDPIAEDDPAFDPDQTSINKFDTEGNYIGPGPDEGSDMNTDADEAFDTDDDSDTADTPETDTVSVERSDKDGRDVEPVDDTDTDVAAVDTESDDATVEIPVDEVNYNVLKAKASNHPDIDGLSSTPSKDELVDALRDHGVTHATVKEHDG